MQLFFLLRLAQMLERKRRCLIGTPVTEWQLRLCNHALYSTYCDCIDHGMREQARLLFPQFGIKTNG